MHPVLFRIPILDIPIHTYGLMIVSGFLLAMFISFKEAYRHDPDLAEDVLDFGFSGLLGGLIGARVLFMLTKWDEYIQDPIKFVKFWEGGLVFYGAAAGGMIAFFWFARKRKYLFRTTALMADTLVVGLPLAHAFGRFGCIAAGCCFGAGRYTVDAAGAINQTIPLVAQFPQGSLAYSSLIKSADPTILSYMQETGYTVPLFPAQIIESFTVACIALLLIFVRSRKRFHGQVFITYILLYGAYRFTIEFFRGDEARGLVYGLSTSQWFTIAMYVAAIFFYSRIVKNRNAKLEHSTV